MNKILLLILSVFIAACGNPQVVYSKPSAPVAIEYSAPKTIVVGEQVITTVRFVAKVNLQQLVVSALPYSGLELLSGGDRVEFTDIQDGGFREIQINIRLAKEVGYLSIFATTTDLQGNVQSKSIAVRYGTAIQKTQPKSLIESSKGEKLILMPGDAR